MSLDPLADGMEDFQSAANEVFAGLAETHTQGPDGASAQVHAAARSGWLDVLGPAEQSPTLEQVVGLLAIARAAGQELTGLPVLWSALARRLDGPWARVDAEQPVSQSVVAIVAGDRVIGHGRWALRAVGSTVAVVEVHDRTERLRCIDPGLELFAADIGAPVALGVERELFDLALAGQLLGIATAALSRSVAYVTQRHQFGRPIGGFQAVKHRCAEMYTRLRLAESQLFFAADRARCTTPQAWATEVRVAYELAADAAWRNAADNLQNHGAFGFALESGPGRYVQRTEILRALHR